MNFVLLEALGILKPFSRKGFKPPEATIKSRILKGFGTEKHNFRGTTRILAPKNNKANTLPDS